MSYSPLFDPGALARTRGQRPTKMVPYQYDAKLTLAVNVALAANRPLLLSGLPGSGKSSLARDVAWLLGRRYEEYVVTSRIQAQDLKWRFDAVRRLAEAQAKARSRGSKLDDRRYVEPGVLWRAFDLPKARQHGKDPQPPSKRAPRQKGVVVLIDEIDKADPDVPNDLLVVLDQRWFPVDDIGDVVRAPVDLELFMVITTNGERDLPLAFLRRCIDYNIDTLSIDWIKSIARVHFPSVSEALLHDLGKTMEEIQTRGRTEKRRPPSTAEFLDALRALTALEITEAKSDIWRDVTEATLWKVGSERAPR